MNKLKAMDWKAMMRIVGHLLIVYPTTTPNGWDVVDTEDYDYVS